MANIITINRPDVVALIENAAKRLTGGNNTEGVALGMRRLLDQESRSGSLFGAHRGSVRVREGSTLSPPPSMSNPTPRPVEKSTGDEDAAARYARNQCETSGINYAG